MSCRSEKKGKARLAIRPACNQPIAIVDNHTKEENDEYKHVDIYRSCRKV
jgi:hypothetical protein